jgi:hypothetical protein
MGGRPAFAGSSHGRALSVSPLESVIQVVRRRKDLEAERTRAGVAQLICVGVPRKSDRSLGTPGHVGAGDLITPRAENETESWWMNQRESITRGRGAAHGIRHSP